MTSLGDRMDAIMGGAGGEPPSPLELARAFRDHFGSGRKAAAAMGVNESTFRRVLSGKTASPKVETVGAFARVHRSLSAKSINLDDIRIPVKPRGGSGRERELRAANLKISDPGAAARISAAYQAGGQEAAAVALIREIKDPHYRAWLTPDDLRDLVDAPEAGDYGYDVG